ncbi:hypothetical protein OBBRIDRAFT_798775 [Obba rivulosa]|uniref:Uncharacterized protein n=1 Tax=Obba rivulosa TaxID=1052685 RepID=A0A8E2DGG6_9APHY|nr:hypothetical protein OBBRIDRAFT_798775 [Obba rivulosa]
MASMLKLKLKKSVKKFFNTLRFVCLIYTGQLTAPSGWNQKYDAIRIAARKLKAIDLPLASDTEAEGNDSIPVGPTVTGHYRRRIWDPQEETDSGQPPVDSCRTKGPIWKACVSEQ